MDLALVFFAWLWSLAGRDGTSAPSAPSWPSSPSSPPQLPPGSATTSAPPWPQVVPSGLPPFPGSGWEYDEPPPAAVQQRAGQLVNTLWAQGSGAFKTEQTAGRWITYRAEIVASGKKGVVAYRQKNAAAAPRAPAVRATRPAPPRIAPSSSPTPKTQPPAATPKTVPVRVVIPQRAPTPEQAAQQSAASQAYSLPLASELPDVTEGMGTKANPNKHVVLAQQRLQFHGFKLVADGVFGNATRMAVIELQKRAALAPRDETNAQLKARGFGAVKRETWEVLLQQRPLLSSPLVTV